MTTRRQPGAGGSRPGSGRKPYAPSKAQRQLVASLMQCGVSITAAHPLVINPATEKPLHYQTFIKVFSDEIRNGLNLANANVTANLYKIATGDSAQAASAAFNWLRCRAGWRPAEIEDVKPPAEDAPRTFNSEAEVEERVKDLVARYGRPSRAA
jgi:hypothetical protein